ncbi:NADH:ubiquinone reductase (Na(+)-transporting) subunit B [Pseudooceanicola nitratireducens]|jgi:Na+-transporting NADH:ubiquinone oxidoreductase subunit B|uniref:Na(+)-translocating NADH-quinone reductase subunit B n=1 Tax=Pseudooceanicola nitratireducens TaxID=517719 RepID=A0A1I1L0E5_9RHOB|nr:NADH:ubiquinone reductase (Na(+)-transporting) subunit B [Pseudooceanicola nitratireducens]MBY6158698.1 NADH:ubiquinone reductase (Na(+)-transporting) subunit B [Pseudooceanicola nitratireducens]MBY6165612.1 NADH:ubiquinone reductase (Na(+)-transporting) subunit B [Pseudooceanicola nitratireducens]SEJ43329.1 Na+-transporting NADH:ubiquinone oxidoreductase subunit B [Pseudooceanicola nitratireducens]SFC63873.1 Na+-transporting NADH:ubiquinone oxidoreductase subunit B [Pseudooceanicola nitrati
MGLRSFFDRIEPSFEKGGKYEKFFPLYEMVESFLYTPKTVTTAAPHARSYIDMKRIMTYVVLATVPCILFALYNTGLQTNMAIAEYGASGWRAAVIDALGIGFNAANPLANMAHGLLYFLPIYIVTLVAGGIWEVLFATIRRHEVNEGFLVSSMLYTLILPASTPLWQVALGISFGVVIGKEVFGGTGKNFLNPALVGRAFLYFAYPAYMSGDTIWTPVDGFSGATALAVTASEGPAALPDYGITWMDAFVGTIQGSMGETSTIACLLGLVFLLATRIANYRMVVGCLAGMIAFSSLLNWIGSDSNPAFATPWYWHLVIGGYAFGLVFMVTEPVSGSHTNLGRYIYGALIGFMVVMIRVINPAFPEGMMLAILFGNVFAPLIDYFVVQANIRRRARRNV